MIDQYLDFISSVVPNYSLGRQHGYTDDEIERIVTEAFFEARSLLQPKVVECCRISARDVINRCPTCYINMELEYDYCPWCGQQLTWLDINQRVCDEKWEGEI